MTTKPLAETIEGLENIKSDCASTQARSLGASIMIDIEETLCWKCSKTYQIEAEKCPYCGAANGNVDLEKAQAEQLHDFARKMRNAPDMLRKCRHGRVFDGTTCPECREEFKGHMDEGVQVPTLGPIDGNWSNTALENWFPYSAEELERLKRENALLARALAKEVNGPTFMGEPIIDPRSKPIAWVVAVEEQGRMKVYSPQYNWRGHAEQDAELPRKRGQKAEVWACYPTAPPVNKGSNDRNNSAPSTPTTSEDEYAAPAVAQEPVAWPKVYGVGRMFDNEKALLVAFDRKPTDDELRAVDDLLKGRAAPQAQRVEERRTVPFDDILAQIDHIEQNGLSLAKYGGAAAQEGRCRELCAMYLREFIINEGMAERLRELDRNNEMGAS